MAGEKLGLPLNVDRELARVALEGKRKLKNRVHLVGVELEGGWIQLPGNVEPQRDASVFRHGFKPEDIEKTKLLQKVGEIPLEPLSPKTFPATFMLFYPDYVDQSCGMHVHLSLKRPFIYQRLMVNHPYSYPATIVRYIERWALTEQLPADHPIWSRLANQNEYCQHIFHADEQVRTSAKDFDHHREGHRYTVVSFCWSRYKTVECRLLPMMQTAAQGVRAVQEVINITNAFLAASVEKEPFHRSAVVESDDVEMAEHRVYI